MRILLVGAGTVGQVFGHHLQRGGAEIGFLVRPKYAELVRRGFDMDPRNPGRGRERLEQFEVTTEHDASGWDQVWLCIPSTALDGEWLETLAASSSAPLVSFSAGLPAQARLNAVAPGRIATAVIAYSAWTAPLPGASGPPGTAWWTPPLMSCVFAGPGAEAAAETLTRGGLRAKVTDAEAALARGASLLTPLIAAMECGGWTFAGLRVPALSRLTAAAMAEASFVSAAVGGHPVGLLPRGLSGLMVRVLTRLAPWVAPFDLETFFRVHFTKVGPQTSRTLGGWIEAGRSRGLSVSALSELHDRLLVTREEPAPR